MAPADTDALNNAWYKFKSHVDALRPVGFCWGHLLLWASGTIDPCDMHTSQPCTYCQSEGEPCLELHASFNRVLRQLIHMRSSEITVRDKDGNDKVVREFTPQQCRGYAVKVLAAFRKWDAENEGWILNYGSCRVDGEEAFSSVLELEIKKRLNRGNADTTGLLPDVEYVECDDDASFTPL